MYYKIVTKDKSLINKASNIFTSLNMNESIHIQEVDFWLIDSNTLDNQSIQSYINKKSYSFILFIVNDDEQIKTCLENGFTHYIKNNFTKNELISWCKHFFALQKNNTVLNINESSSIDFNKNQYHEMNNVVNLTLQEIALLKAINKDTYISTLNLMNILKISSQSGVRSIINRIRKKTNHLLISHKRHYGYKLNLLIEDNPPKNNNQMQIKDLEEQNLLMQEIIDCSSVYIATFVHKQLYCINKSFREYLGSDIIKELWNETNGDFFQLIKHNSKDKEELKESLFTLGSKKIELYNFNENNTNLFNVKTYYFEKIDKHLLIFEEV